MQCQQTTESHRTAYELNEDAPPPMAFLRAFDARGSEVAAQPFPRLTSARRAAVALHRSRPLNDVRWLTVESDESVTVWAWTWNGSRWIETDASSTPAELAKVEEHLRVAEQVDDEPMPVRNAYGPHSAPRTPAAAVDPRHPLSRFIEAVEGGSALLRSPVDPRSWEPREAILGAPDGRLLDVLESYVLATAEAMRDRVRELLANPPDVSDIEDAEERAAVLIELLAEQVDRIDPGSILRELR
ncbi:MAG: hypothetical protein H5U40_14290 [Polyangiaceae bacterium]|nr:hypothetical protein [Polyangiaceae bacterium]